MCIVVVCWILDNILKLLYLRGHHITQLLYRQSKALYVRIIDKAFARNLFHNCAFSLIFVLLSEYMNKMIKYTITFERFLFAAL